MPRSSKSRRTTVKSSPSQNEAQEQEGGDGGGEGSSSELTFGQKVRNGRMWGVGVGGRILRWGLPERLWPVTALKKTQASAKSRAVVV